MLGFKGFFRKKRWKSRS